MSVVKETEQDGYALTPFAAALQSSSPLSAAFIHRYGCFISEINGPVFI
jgi:hypothetical protein